ncbi:hypothetical protein PMAYCL1PPCAC_27955, partial [Pristionchus mayeri]
VPQIPQVVEGEIGGEEANIHFQAVPESSQPHRLDPRPILGPLHEFLRSLSEWLADHGEVGQIRAILIGSEVEADSIEARPCLPQKRLPSGGKWVACISVLHFRGN